MVRYGCRVCPKCGGRLKRYDRAKRYLKVEYGRRAEIFLYRYKCSKCGRTHREIPKEVYPYKQYSARIILGFVNGRFGNWQIEFEDYPSELTVKIWTREICKFG